MINLIESHKQDGEGRKVRNKRMDKDNTREHKERKLAPEILILVYL